MNTLIIPTDFSPTAENAMYYAAELALVTEADILLAHVYQIPVSMNDMPVILISAEELKKSADDNLDRCRQELSNAYPGLTIKIESRLGDVHEELDNLCKRIKPLAIVMGSHGISGFERLIFGSTTVSVIRHSRFPVIAVPSNFKQFSLRKIAMAADLQDAEKTPFEKIIEMAQHFNASFHIVHVVNKEEKDSDLQRDILLNQLQPLHPVYQTIHSDNVTEGLLNYLKDVQADLLLVLPHEHNFIERLFSKLHAVDIVSHAPIPVMTIRS